MSKILVVEDDAQQRSAIAEALLKAGHRVEEASSGNQALARLSQSATTSLSQTS
jgi:CheY-like chemotaxis protein